MKIAVTGATGFVGKHVIERLLHTDVEIVASSRHSPTEGWSSSKVRHVALDMAFPSDQDYKALGSPDVLIHLAWAGLPNYASLHHFEVELPRQYAFLKSMIQAGLPSLVVAGTCYEYGLRGGELVESMEGVPSNPYGYAKAALRSQLEFLRARQPFDVTWARMFYMYGEGQPPTSLYTQLVQAVRRGDKSFPMSHGEQLRDFLPVTEVAEALVKLAIETRGAGVVNVCSGRPVSVRDFVGELLKRNGWSIDLELGRLPYSTYEPIAFWGSPVRLHALVGAGSQQPGI